MPEAETDSSPPLAVAEENREGNAVAEDSLAARKKADENRKKRERQKAKKKADKVAEAAEAAPAQEAPSAPSVRESGAGLNTGFHADGEIEALAATSLRSERRHAGEGRGLGMFAVESVEPGQLVAAAAPALSVVFDSAAMTTCGFCFASVEPAQPVELLNVTIRANVIAAAGGAELSFGVVLDDAEGGGVAVRGFAPGSANLGRGEGSLEMGDKIAQIGGQEVSGDKQAVAAALKAAAAAALNAARLGPADSAAGSVIGVVELECKVERPPLVPCMSCRKLSACRACVSAGCLSWHRHECGLFCHLPAGCKAGADTSVLRMLLRYRASLTEGVGEWSAHKERTPLVMLTLQKNECKVGKQQLGALSRLTGVRELEAAAIIYAIRTNACEVQRGGAKVGCALSALMGWHNHDCAPNAAARVGEDGQLRIEALRGVAADDEVLISYIDAKQPVDARRAILEQHYGFRCGCTRCRDEQRRALKSRLPKQKGW